MLTPYKLWIEIAVLIALVGGAVLGVHEIIDHYVQKGYDKRVAEDRVQEAKDTEAARVKEQQQAQQLKEANDASILANQRVDKMAEALATSNAAAAAGLRGASARVLGNLPGASPEAATATAVTFAELFGDCVARYSERYSTLANKADRHVIDIQTFQAAP